MASSPHRTLYNVLGIHQQAQLKEVRDAYRKLALKHHPDKDPRNPRAVATFQEVSTSLFLQINAMVADYGIAWRSI